MIKEIAECMMNKANLVKIFKDDEEFKGNIRKCPFYSELKGMEQMLKIMGIEFEYGFNDDIEITSITIEGITVEA